MKLVASNPPVKVQLTGQRDPQRVASWLRDLIARARAAKAEKTKAA